MTLNKLIYKIKYMFRDRRYDVYCPHCSSCGETGCCKPTICINHPKGFYCERNMGELRSTYYTMNSFYNWFHANKGNKKLSKNDVFQKLHEIMDKEDDELEEYLKNLPEKLTLKEKILKFIKR